jgi:hypothetical protein
MCEAYGLTSDPTLKVSAQRAIDFICRSGDGGGWDYSSRTARIDTCRRLAACAEERSDGRPERRRPRSRRGEVARLRRQPDKSGYGYSGPGETHTMSVWSACCAGSTSAGRRNRRCSPASRS